MKASKQPGRVLALLAADRTRTLLKQRPTQTKLPEGAKAILRRLGSAASARDGGDCDGGGGGVCGGEGDVVQVLGAGGDGRRGAATRAPQARRRRPRGQPCAGHPRLRLEPGPPRAFVSLRPLYRGVADGETGERNVFLFVTYSDREA